MTDELELDNNQDTTAPTPETAMFIYEADRRKLAEMEAGPDGNVIERWKELQNYIAFDEAQLKNVVKATGQSVTGTTFVAIFQPRKQAPQITWDLETIKTQPWAPAVLIEQVDAKTFEALVSSGRIPDPDRYRTITAGPVIKAVIIKGREEPKP